jgi:(p)ppGpp synthase/HD superfamily hydrolase
MSCVNFTEKPGKQKTGRHSLILRAARFACERHAGQTKPRQKRSVIDHCLEVALLVSDAGLPEEAVAAALLHDTVEKSETTQHELEAEFGTLVRVLVEAVTDVPWETEASAKGRLKAAPADAQSIKCADIVSNLGALARQGALTAEDRTAKAAKLAVLDKADPALAQRADSLIGYGMTVA